jgi:GAF domain-containing protein
MTNAIQLHTLLADLHDVADPDQALQRVVDTAVALIDCDASATALLRDHKHIQQAAFTDDLAKRAALLQLELNGGPCLTAMREGGTIRIDNTLTDDRWPSWCAAVAEFGVRSSISVSLVSGDPRSLGSLFVYSRQVNAFDAEDTAAVQILARHATIAVRRNRKQANMTRAIDTRTVIGQAEGIVMTMYDITADQAFAVLTRYSQASNRKLRDIAAEVVRARTLPADVARSAI